MVLDIKTLQFFLALQTALLVVLFCLMRRSFEKRIFYYLVNLAFLISIVSLLVLNVIIGHSFDFLNNTMATLKYLPDLVNAQINSNKEIYQILLNEVLPGKTPQPPSFKTIFDSPDMFIAYCASKATPSNIGQALPVILGLGIQAANTPVGAVIIGKIASISSIFFVVPVPVISQAVWIGAILGGIYSFNILFPNL